MPILSDADDDVTDNTKRKPNAVALSILSHCDIFFQLDFK